MCGIYIITNNVNGKVYIGQAIDIHSRFIGHKYKAFEPNGQGYNYPLYRAIRKYGLENFSFEVLEECDRDKLNELEIFYIEKYNAYGPGGYNQTAGGNQSYNGNKLTDELVLGIIDRLGKSFDNSEKIGEEFGVSSWMVRSINRGTYWPIEGIEYPIREHLSSIKRRSRTANKNAAIAHRAKKITNKIQVAKTAKRYKATTNELASLRRVGSCKICGTKTSGRSECCPKCSHMMRRKSERPEPLELARMVKEIGFRNVGAKYGVSDRAIAKWCKSYGIPHKLNDLIAWYNEQVGIVDHPKPTKKRPEDYMKPVKQIDPITHRVLKIFKSIGAAARDVGCANSPSNISKACKEGRMAAGYLWEFA